ncbi:hypothetical protein WG66_002770 [Moniliophthora roreri]|nr:hypothetical protein WG66_002770 [Moniliophthora roreri]
MPGQIRSLTISHSAVSSSSPISSKRSSLLHSSSSMHSHQHSRPTLFDVESGVQLQRHSDLWFDDGSIVCRAENTLFRVHMSQLSRHSLCFRDMFSIGSFADPVATSSIVAEDGTPVFTNCPVIILHDAAEDVGNLFTALYDGPNFGNNDHDDFRIVSGILRLATKYLIDSLREKAIAHLSIAWPSTLKGWDAREEVAHAFEMENESRCGRLYPSPIAVINLVRQVDAPSLLPAAFYDLSRYSCSQIFEPTEDELFYIGPPSTPASPSRIIRESAYLTPSDTRRLCLGKESSQHAVTTLIQAIGHAPSRNSPPLQSAFALAHPLAFQPHVPYAYFSAPPISFNHRRSSSAVCTSVAECRKDFNELVDLATQHYIFDRSRGCYDPLYVAEELGQLKSDLSECKACARSLELWAARERERIWKMIPVWFRLGGRGEPSGGNGETTSPPPADI